MRQYSQSEYLYATLIVIAAVFLCFINLGGHIVYILDEAKNAEAAREMLVNRNWVVPTFNGELRTDKPVLHYWFMIFAYKIFGVSSFSARFFSAVFGVLTILSTYHFTKKFIGLKTGLITTFIICSAIFFIQEFHLAVPDPYLIFFVSFALFNFYDFYRYGNRLNWLLFYSCIGLGVLAKGPVAILLPGLIGFIFLIAKKELNWKTIKKFNPLLGGIVTIFISFPWFYLVHIQTEGAFTKGFFLQHNLQRFSGEMEGHGGLPFVTWAFVLLGLLPYSFFIIQGFISGWKNRKLDDFTLFSFIISSVFIVFFSISITKLPNYPMPSYPFVAILIAGYLKNILEDSIPKKGYLISLWVLFSITLLIPIAGYIALSYAEPQLYTNRFSSLVLLILPAGIGMSIVYFYQKKIRESLIAIGLSSMFLSLELFQFVYPKLVTQTPVSIALKELDMGTEKFIFYKGFDPAFLFNAQRTFPLAETKNEAQFFLNENPEGIIITKEKFYKSDWQNTPTEILLKQKALFENYTIVIFKIK